MIDLAPAFLKQRSSLDLHIISFILDNVVERTVTYLKVSKKRQKDNENKPVSLSCLSQKRISFKKSSRIHYFSVQSITRDLECTFPAPATGRFPDLQILCPNAFPVSQWLRLHACRSHLLTVTSSCRNCTCFPFTCCYIFLYRTAPNALFTLFFATIA